MDYERRRKKHQDTLAGYEEQEILIDRLSGCISDIVGMNHQTMKMYVSKGLEDALEKRHKKFRDIKATTQDEKTRFVSDVVYNTIKRAKLVQSVDKIIPECNRIYDEWKHEFRPEEVGEDE